jgi:hypothetical protein
MTGTGVDDLQYVWDMEQFYSGSYLINDFRKGRRTTNLKSYFKSSSTDNSSNLNQALRI